MECKAWRKPRTSQLIKFPLPRRLWHTPSTIPVTTGASIAVAFTLFVFFTGPISQHYTVDATVKYLQVSARAKHPSLHLASAQFPIVVAGAICITALMSLFPSFSVCFGRVSESKWGRRWTRANWQRTTFRRMSLYGGVFWWPCFVWHLLKAYVLHDLWSQRDKCAWRGSAECAGIRDL